MTIFQKIAAAIQRFNDTADRMEHKLLAEALADKVYVIEWLHARIQALEAKLGIKPAPLPTPVENSTVVTPEASAVKAP